MKIERIHHEDKINLNCTNKTSQRKPAVIAFLQSQKEYSVEKNIFSYITLLKDLIL